MITIAEGAPLNMVLRPTRFVKYYDNIYIFLFYGFKYVIFYLMPSDFKGSALPRCVPSSCFVPDAVPRIVPDCKATK